MRQDGDRGEQFQDAGRLVAPVRIAGGEHGAGGEVGEDPAVGLDVLGRTPWQINKDVYGVMIEAWNAGEGIGELVPGDIDVSLPEEPPSGAPMAERIRWYKQVKEIAEKRQGLHSKRCFQNLQLEINYLKSHIKASEADFEEHTRNANVESGMLLPLHYGSVIS